MNKNTTLELKDISKYFYQGSERLEVLKGLNLEIKQKEIVALVGPSGSGKSTLMQDLLYEYAKHKIYKNKPKPQGVDEIKGFENIDKIIAKYNKIEN